MLTTGFDALLDRAAEQGEAGLDTLLAPGQANGEPPPPQPPLSDLPRGPSVVPDIVKERAEPPRERAP